MMPNQTTESTHVEEVSKQLLEQLDEFFGLHAGFRPVHAKGVMLKGTFKASAEAKVLTRAPHVQAESVEALLRFSNFGGIPTIADTDPNAAPRGIAVRFFMEPHVHTDIIGHTHNGFPTRTGEEFLELLKGLVLSKTETEKPNTLDRFMASHPVAAAFFAAPNPVPSSFSKESYFAVTAFKFINKEGKSCFGRFQIHPGDSKTDYLDAGEVTEKGAMFLFEELDERIARGPIKMKIIVEIAEESDEVNDATVTWPANRQHVDFGTVTLTGRVPDNDMEAQRTIFDPIPRVDGIDPSRDPLIEVRSALYLLSGRRRRAAMKHE
jgi:catalase